MAEGTELARLTVALDARIDQFERKVAQAEKRLQQTGRKVQQSGREIDATFAKLGDGLARIAGPVALAEGMRRLAAATISAGEQVRQLEGRFRALTGSQQRAGGLLAGTFGAAAGTGASLATVGQLVAQFRLATNQIGASDEQVVQFSENLIKLGVVGGASTTEIANGLRQLSQGLAGGVLRAEEFNSVIENTPMVAQALADALAGGSLGALRAMVLEGRVLSEDVFRAILGQTEQINRQFGEMPMTIERAANNLGTEMTALLAQLDDATGLSQFIADGFQRAAEAAWALTEALGSARGTPSSIAAEIEGARLPEMPGWGPWQRGGSGGAAGAPGGNRPPPPARRGSRARPRDPFAEVMGGLRTRDRTALEAQVEAQLGANPALTRENRDQLMITLRAVNELREAYRRLAAETGRPVQVVTPEQVAQIENQAMAIASAEAETRRIAEAQERAARAAEAHERALEGLEDTLIDNIARAESFEDAIKSVARALLASGLQGLASGRGAFGGFFNDAFGVASGGLGGLIRGAFGDFGEGPTLNANGNAFGGGRVIPFARGGVVSRPTVFPMADGTGLMGEAGPEAILPLRRGPGGRLGVEAGSGGSSVRILLDPGLRAEIVGEARGQTVEIVQASQQGPGFAARVAAASKTAADSRMR